MAKKDAGKVLGPPRTANYHPTYVRGPWWGQGGYGMFTTRVVDEMRFDSQVSHCLNFRMAPIYSAEFDVSASHSGVKKYVQDILDRFWRCSLNVALEMLAYGYNGSEPIYAEEKGSIVFDYLRPIHAFDIKPWTYKGQLQRLRVTNTLGVTRGSNGGDVDLPVASGKVPAKGLWLVHDSMYSQWFGRSVLAPAWLPWRFKTMPDGAHDIINKWYYKHAYSGMVVKYPNRTYQDELGGPEIPAKDFALQMGEQVKSGANLALPSEKDQNGNPLWEIAQYAEANGDGGGLIEYLNQYLDIQIQRGIGIPDEVITHQGATGGYSRSMVALAAFMMCEEQILNNIVEVLDDQVIRPLVLLNYGGKAQYKIKPKSLVEAALSQQQGGQPVGAGVTGMQQPGQQPVMPQDVQFESTVTDPIDDDFLQEDFETDDQSDQFKGNDIGATVGGMNAFMAMQEKYVSGTLSREMALANCTIIFGLEQDEAERLFPLDKPNPEDQQQGGQQPPVGMSKKMDHIRWNGLGITIENKKGTIREKTGSEGKTWSRKMACDYGYFKRTKSGADGDHIDVFVGPHLKSELVFVVDQLSSDGSFDEHKCVIGARTQEEAKNIYKTNYPKGWKIGVVTPCTLPQFKKWLCEGDSVNPFAVQMSKRRRMGWTAARTRTGKLKATNEKQQTLYGKDAEAALARQNKTYTPNDAPITPRKPKAPTSDSGASGGPHGGSTGPLSPATGPLSPEKVHETLTKLADNPQDANPSRVKAWAGRVWGKAKGAFTKARDSMVADGVSPRIANTVAGVSAATLLPGVSICNVVGIGLAASGNPILGGSLMALPSGWFEAPILIGGSKTIGRVLKKVQKLRATKMAKGEKISPQDVAQILQDNEKQIKKAAAQASHPDTFVVALIASVSAGDQVRDALAIASKVSREETAESIHRQDPTYMSFQRRFSRVIDA